ncbi:MAG: HEAT repeat domain-containing protein [Planctomycetes bacterium]|nr:HEAT repeat domain-containing protein [Planctomycetota bacterium]
MSSPRHSPLGPCALRALLFVAASVGALSLPLPAQALFPARPDDIAAAGPSAGQSMSPATWWKWNSRAYLPALELHALEEGAARKALAMAMRELEHEHAQVRAAAARAVGRASRRCASPEVVPLLRRALNDASEHVRFDAVLALGWNGSRAAQELLLEIIVRNARREALPLRAWAILALALSESGASTAHVDAGLETWQARSSTMPQELALALDLRSRLAAAPSSSDRSANATTLPAPTPSWSIERGIECSPELRLETIDRGLRSSDLHTRRSAALELGELESAGAAELLRATLRREREHLTRAFLFLSLGRRGDPESRSALERAWRDESTSLRPWCALALGLHARRTDDAELRDQLLRTCARERNQELFCATLLACGIAGERRAEDLAIETVESARTPAKRVAAARTLSLIGGAAARVPLREAIFSESCPTTRAVLAEALGRLAIASDAAFLLDYLIAHTEEAHRKTIARSIARLGAPVLPPLEAALARADLGPEARASLLDVLGWLGAGEEAAAPLARILVGSNYMAYPEWLQRALTRLL